MLTVSNRLLAIAGILLCIEAILMAARIPNPIPGRPLPCPITILTLGAGILLFAFSSKSFKK